MSAKTPKTQKPVLPEPPPPMTMARVVEAMKAVGYESVEFVGKNIQVEIPGAARDRTGNRQVQPLSVHDVILAPGLLTADGNWPAIKVAVELPLNFREFQLVGADLILRDVRDLQA